MKKQITNISPVQTSKVISLLYFFVSLPFLFLMGIMASFSAGPEPQMLGMFFAMPFIYLIMGFIFTAIAAWAYNLVAKWVGGIEFTTSDIDN